MKMKHYQSWSAEVKISPLFLLVRQLHHRLIHKIGSVGSYDRWLRFFLWKRVLLEIILTADQQSSMIHTKRHFISFGFLKSSENWCFIFQKPKSPQISPVPFWDKVLSLLLDLGRDLRLQRRAPWKKKFPKPNRLLFYQKKNHPWTLNRRIILYMFIIPALQEQNTHKRCLQKKQADAVMNFLNFSFDKNEQAKKTARRSPLSNLSPRRVCSGSPVRMSFSDRPFNNLRDTRRLT